MTVQKQEISNTQLICQAIATKEQDYKLSLPAHISPAKFVRIAQGAIANTPGLEQCTRPSIYLAVEQAAKDGLPIDGKMAAIVVFNKNIAKKGQTDQWVKEAKYMPMAAGLLQLARNTGMITTPTSEIIYEKDKFLYHIKNGKVEISHEPAIFAPDRGKPMGVYSSCMIKGTEEVVAEVLTADQVQSIRNCSKAKDSLMWTTFWQEGWKKSAFRRLYKRLPSSADKEHPEMERFSNAIQRDDDLYEFDEVVEANSEVPTNVTPISSAPKQTKAAAAVAASTAPVSAMEEVPFESSPIYEDDVI